MLEPLQTDLGQHSRSMPQKARAVKVSRRAKARASHANHLAPRNNARREARPIGDGPHALGRIASGMSGGMRGTVGSSEAGTGAHRACAHEFYSPPESVVKV